MGKALKLVPADFIINNPTVSKCTFAEAEFCTNLETNYGFYKFIDNLTIETALNTPFFSSLEKASRSSFIEYLKAKYPLLLTLKVSILAEYLKLDSFYIIDILFTDAFKYHTYLYLSDYSSCKRNLLNLLDEKYRKFNTEITLE